MHSSPDRPPELMKLTGGKGADILVETGGQATLGQSMAATVNARIVIIGGLAGTTTGGIPNLGTIIGKTLIVKGIAAGNWAMLEHLLRAVEANCITPVINKVFSFD